MNKANKVTGEKEIIIEALQKWLRQKSGLSAVDYGGYCDLFCDDTKRINTNRRDAKRLLAVVAGSKTITADNLKEAFKSAYMGRLSWNGSELEYCTGQFYPTEFAMAALAVLTWALWNDIVKFSGCKDRAMVISVMKSVFGYEFCKRNGLT